MWILPTSPKYERRGCAMQRSYRGGVGRDRPAAAAMQTAGTPANDGPAEVVNAILYRRAREPVADVAEGLSAEEQRWSTSTRRTEAIAGSHELLMRRARPGPRPARPPVDRQPVGENHDRKRRPAGFDAGKKAPYPHRQAPRLEGSTARRARCPMGFAGCARFAGAYAGPKLGKALEKRPVDAGTSDRQAKRRRDGLHPAPALGDGAHLLAVATAVCQRLRGHHASAEAWLMIASITKDRKALKSNNSFPAGL